MASPRELFPDSSSANMAHDERGLACTVSGDPCILDRAVPCAIRGRDRRPLGGLGRLMATKKNPNLSRDPDESPRQCQQRFESLIELSCDWYWEQDEHYRFT